MMERQINKHTTYIGVDDTDLDLFEGQYKLDEGVSYNSYLIQDEKIAVMDTVDARMGDEWMDLLKTNLGSRIPDYLIVHHMEPDHASCIEWLMNLYPTLTAVCTQKAAALMTRFFETDFSQRLHIVKEGDTINLGQVTLSFIMAPMVHWPEVMMSYDSLNGTLFSADAFGKFGALSLTADGSKGLGSIWGDKHEWACEARRYYFNIVGKYGPMVQNVLKKTSALNLQTICPLHGPILHDDLSYFTDLYNTWSSYTPETPGVFIAYCSLHGNTEQAALMLQDMIQARNIKVAISDLRRDDMAEAVEDAFRYPKLIICAPTYDGNLMPVMHDFLHHLQIKNYQRRRVAIIENGSWAPMAGKKMAEMLGQMKDIEIIEPMISIPSRVTGEVEQQLKELAEKL